MISKHRLAGVLEWRISVLKRQRKAIVETLPDWVDQYKEGPQAFEKDVFIFAKHNASIIDAEINVLDELRQIVEDGELDE